MNVPLPPGLKNAPELNASYKLAREARKQQPEQSDSGMKPSKFLENEQSIQDWRRDAEV
jgi:hypothetical protein